VLLEHSVALPRDLALREGDDEIWFTATFLLRRFAPCVIRLELEIRHLPSRPHSDSHQPRRPPLLFHLLLEPSMELPLDISLLLLNSN